MDETIGEQKTHTETRPTSEQISANTDFHEIRSQGDPSHKPARIICRFCGSSLATPGAWKCVECSEYQIWPLQVFSLIGLSNLALLVAVASLAWVAVKDFVRGEQAALKLRVLQCTTSHIHIAVFNSGSQPGLLSGLMLAIVDTNVTDAKKAKARFPLDLDVNGKVTGVIQVDPKKPVGLTYAVTSPMKNAYTPDCSLRIVADKYEEAKPQNRIIDQAACACTETL